MTARGIVYLRHATQGAFSSRFSRRFLTARKSILVLVSQSKNHTPDYCDTKNRIIAILKLFPPKGGKIISVTQCRGPECGQNHPFFYSLLNFSKLMFP